MEFLIPLKDIVIGPGKRFDPSTGSEDDVIALIKKTYGFLAETMEVSIHEGMVRIKFKDSTPEKINEALNHWRVEAALDASDRPTAAGDFSTTRPRCFATGELLERCRHEPVAGTDAGRT